MSGLYLLVHFLQFSIVVIILVVLAGVPALSDTLCRSVGDDYNIDCGGRRNLSGCHYFLKGKRKMMTGEIPKGSITVNIPNMAEFEAVVLMDNFEPLTTEKNSLGEAALRTAFRVSRDKNVLWPVSVIIYFPPSR